MKQFDLSHFVYLWRLLEQLVRFRSLGFWVETVSSHGAPPVAGPVKVCLPILTFTATRGANGAKSV